MPPISNPHQVCLTVGSILKLEIGFNFPESNPMIEFLLEEVYSTALLGDGPHVGQASVEVAGRYAEDATDSNEHEQSLKDVGDEDSLDSTHRGIKSANHPYQQDAHVP